MINRFPAKLLKISEIHEAEYIKPENEAGYLDFNGLKVHRVLVYGVVINKMESDVSETITIDDGTGNIDIRSFDKIEQSDEIDIGDLVMVVGRIREFGRKYVLYEMIRKLDQVKWFEFFELLRELERKLLTPSHSEIQVSESKQENLYGGKPLEVSVQEAVKPPSSISSIPDKFSSDAVMSSNVQQSQALDEINVSQLASNIPDEALSGEINDANSRTEGDSSNAEMKLNEKLQEKLVEFEEEIDNVSKLLKVIETLDSGEGAEYDEIQKHYNQDDLDDLLMRLLESGDIYEFRPRRYKVL